MAVALRASMVIQSLRLARQPALGFGHWSLVIGCCDEIVAAYSGAVPAGGGAGSGGVRRLRAPVGALADRAGPGGGPGEGRPRRHRRGPALPPGAVPREPVPAGGDGARRAGQRGPHRPGAGGRSAAPRPLLLDPPHRTHGRRPGRLILITAKGRLT